MPKQNLEYLFEDITRLYFDTNLWTKCKNLGASRSEIEIFENSINIEFSKGIREYFSFFGNAPQFGGVCSFSFENIKFAINESKNDEYYQKNILEGFVTLKSEEEEWFNPIHQTCMVYHIDYNGYYSLIRLNEYNPILYDSYGLDEGLGGYNNITLSNYIRKAVYFDFSRIINIKNDIEKFGNTSKYLNIYSQKASEINLKNHDFLNSINSYTSRGNDRIAFEHAIQTIELENNFIYSFSEMEKEYIEKSI